MKTRFSSLDIACIVKELRSVIGMRVNQIYDIDGKTYLIKFQASEKKAVILFESGNRIHRTNFDWPKNDHPSGFSMKLRKHLRNKRLEKIAQLGEDRIIDMVFGSGAAAYHIFLELFDKGNVILTDHALTIVYILRPHTEKNMKFLIKEVYPLDRSKPPLEYSSESLAIALKEAKDGELLKKVLVPLVYFGPSVVDHIISLSGFQKGEKIKGSLSDEQIQRLVSCTNDAVELTKRLLAEPAKGYIMQKEEKKAGGDFLLTNIDFQPYLFIQYSKDPFVEFDDFNTAVDEYFSKLGTQKIDLKALQEEKNALKKVEKIRLDQESRLKDLDKKQIVDATKAELIMYNVDKVEAAILAIRTAVAAQMSWIDIASQVSEAQALSDPIASMIKKLKLQTNQITLYLTHPFQEDEQEIGALVDVDLDLSAYANVKKYHSDKKQALSKQQKTLQAQGKVLKEAEKKVEAVLKDIHTNATITKQRTVFWFEKFLWFVSSENYLVIGSRDKIQTELIVRRYLKPGDIFVHSDIPAGSCFVIKNVGSGECPPKTLNEAGTMAVCFSSVWEAHILASAWWVRAEKVEKSTRPDLSYTISGTKSYLPPALLAVGFGFIFYVDEESAPRHSNERLVKNIDLSNEPEESKEEDSEQLVLDNLSIGDDESDDDDDVEESKPEVSNPDRCTEDNSLDTREFHSDDQVENNSDDDDDKLEDGDLEEVKKDNEDSDEDKDDGGYKEGASADNKDVQEADTATKQEEKIIDSSSKNTTGGKHKGKKRAVSKDKVETKPETPKTDSNAPKRGHHGKLKKMRDKYKDQDEEEKMARMAILQSAGTKKESNKKKGKKGEKGKAPEVRKPPPKKPVQKDPSDFAGPIPLEMDEPEVQVKMDLEMINRLTGIPHPEDKILFAMPVVAPYSTVMPYKFRLKVIPGTAKRGKSAKQALNIFLKSKEISEDEKAVMKSVNDQALWRDLPGRIKLSVGQQANKLKKKK